MKTRVVNVRHSRFDVYIGRATYGNRGLRGYGQTRRVSKWANPFRIGPDGTRGEVITKYEQYIRSRPDLMAALPELENKRLGCWCAPKPCHGDILVKLLEERKRGE